MKGNWREFGSGDGSGPIGLEMLREFSAGVERPECDEGGHCSGEGICPESAALVAEAERWCEVGHVEPKEEASQCHQEFRDQF